MKKILSLITIATIFLLGIQSVAAIIPPVAPYAGGLAYGYGSYGSAPINPMISGRFYPYSDFTARAGGWFNWNSATVHSLRPGMYDSPQMNYPLRYQLGRTYYSPTRFYGRSGTYGYLNYGTSGYPSTPRINLGLM